MLLFKNKKTKTFTSPFTFITCGQDMTDHIKCVNGDYPDVILRVKAKQKLLAKSEKIKHEES